MVFYGRFCYIFRIFAEIFTHMTMKKIFGFIFAVVAFSFMTSCGPAEWGTSWEVFLDDIYTVNKHAVVPEYSDTFIRVSNMDSQPLKTGDRARMILRYYYDSSTGKQPEYTIYSLGDIIPTRKLDSIPAIDTLEYNTPFKYLEYVEFIDRHAYPVWVWNNCQNINVSYYGVKDNAQFAMAVKGVDEDVLNFELFAKAQRSNDATTTVLLTYDLNNIGEFLTNEQIKSVANYDTLKTRIYLSREVKDENGVASIEKINFIAGKLANPFKK